MKKIIILIALLLIPQASEAATAYSIEAIDVGLGTADLKSTVLNIIQWVLGILALVAVVMIIFSGVTLATSTDQDRSDRAKRVLIGTIIGLVVVLLAWAIVIFVLGTAAEVIE